LAAAVHLSIQKDGPEIHEEENEEKEHVEDIPTGLSAQAQTIESAQLQAQ
jgi:hypothetical protein